MNLKGKSVLLICPKFFNYYKEISRALEELGADVRYKDERPANNNLVKVIIRLNKNLINKYIEKYYSKIQEEFRNTNFDYLLIVKPEAIPVSFINEFKSIHPNTKICMYLWDSLENNKFALEKIKLADKISSFDKNDCDKYKMNFEPLFYGKKYLELCENENAKEYKYDVLFVGTVHSDRYNVLKIAKEKLLSKGYTPNFYMYIQSKILYYVKKIVKNEFKNAKVTDFQFNQLGYDDLIDLVKESKVIIDIQHEKQTGLTMRTIEMLGANKKIITTNSNVKNYDFYNENNIQIVNRDLSNLNIDFINKEFENVPSDIKNKYYVTEWVQRVIN